MTPAHELARGDAQAFCLAKPGVVYAIYLPSGGEAVLDIGASEGLYEVSWYDPRQGGGLLSTRAVRGSGRIVLGTPPHDAGEDWALVVRRVDDTALPVEAAEAASPPGSSAPGSESAPDAPLAAAAMTPVARELNGEVSVEAESFVMQRADGVRKWHIHRAGVASIEVEPDGDPAHLEGASGDAYIEILPDTRRTHGDPLRQGENFSNDPGRMAIVDYPIEFTTPGRYYVWVRAYCTGTEDNGVHVGLNGTWPESGRRLQWTSRDKWHWDSKQRTDKVHTGVPGQIWLDIPTPGVHVISFSMREDGFEMDCFVLTRQQEWTPPAAPRPPADASANSSASRQTTSPEPASP